MKLNLGSGLKRIDGFLNVDYDERSNPDFIVDLEKGILPFEDNSVDGIVAHHILEHIGEGFLTLMKEIYRVSKDGTIIDIEVPHHRHENFFGDPTHKRPITIGILRQFSKKYNEYHIGQYNSVTGLGIDLNVNFEIVEFNFNVDGDYQDLVVSGNYEQLHEISKRFNNVYTDLKVTLVVIKDE